jgi:iron(III) transport system permease protein
VGRPLTRGARDWQEILVTWGAAAVLGLAITLPLGALGLELALHPGAAFRVLTGPTLLGLFARTVARSAAVTVACVAIGLLLGTLLFRTDVPLRRVTLGAHLLPLFLPPYLLALGAAQLFGRGGLVGSETTSRLLFGEPGAMILEALAFSPVVTGLVGLGLSSVDASLEDAARVFARPWQVLTGVLLPLSWPSVALGALLVFALSFSELGVPMFTRVRAYPAAVFARLGGLQYAPGEAVGLVLPLLGVAAVLLLVERRIAARIRGVRGLRRDAPRLALGRRRLTLLILTAAAGLAGLLPLVGLAARGIPALPNLSRWLGRSVETSVLAAAGTATAVTGLAAVLGYSLGRRGSAGRLVDALATLSFVAPAAVLGIGLVTVWNRPSTAVIYGSLAILVLGWSARYAVLGMRPIALAVSLTPPTFEDAARVSGARFLRLLVSIVAPLQRKALAAGWLFVFAFCLRDLETAVLYYPPGREPLTVRIFTLEANGPPAVVAALALVQLALSGTCVAAGAWLLGQRSK